MLVFNEILFLFFTTELVVKNLHFMVYDMIYDQENLCLILTILTQGYSLKAFNHSCHNFLEHKVKVMQNYWPTFRVGIFDCFLPISSAKPEFIVQQETFEQ